MIWASLELNVHPSVIMRILRHTNMSYTMEIHAEISDEGTRKELQQLVKVSV